MREMPHLRELERRLFTLLRAPDVTAGLETLGLGAADLERVVEGDARLSAAGRVEIYADMYLWRLRDVLRGAFPKLVAFIGDDAFATLATDYLTRHPSRHPSLRHLGQRLPEFLHEAPRGLPAGAADLAALEWARYDVFDEADAPVLAAAALAQLPADRFADLRIRFVPAHRVLTCGLAIDGLWRAIGKDDAPAPAPTPRTLLIWRQGTFVYHRAIEALERSLLASAASGTNFGAICELTAAALEAEAGAVDTAAAAQAAFAVLARWIGDELLVDEGARP